MSRLVLRFGLGVIACCLLALPALGQALIPRDPRYVLHMDISPDNQWLVVSEWLRWSTTLYRLPDRRVVREFPEARAAVFAGSRLLALDTPEGVVLRDFPSLRPVKSLPTSGLLQASRDGRWLLVYENSLFEETAELWQLQPLQRRLRLTLPRYSQVVLSADGRFLFQAIRKDTYATEITVRSTADGRVTQRFQVDTWGLLAVSPNGDRFAIASPQHVRVYRVTDARLLYTFTDIGRWQFSVLCFSPDGNYLAGGYGTHYESGAWRLWRLSDGALVAQETYPYTADDEVWTIDFSDDSVTLYVAFPFRLRLVDTRTGATLDEWQATKFDKALGFLSGGQEFVVADERSVRFYSSVDGLLTRRVELPVSEAPPYASAISGDGSTYAVYPYQNGIGVFRLPASGTATPLLSIPWFPNPNIDEPFSLRLSEDGSLLFVGDASCRVHLVRVADRTVSTLAEGVLFFDTTPDGALLVTVEDVVKVRRVADGALLYTFPSVQWLGVVLGGQALAVVREVPASSSHRISLHDLPTGNVLRETRLLSFAPSDTRETRVSVSPDAKVIVVTRSSRAFRRETALYRWGDSGLELITLWRGDAAPEDLTFSRDGRYVALPSSVILRGFSDKVGAQGKLIIHGWLGLLPEHLRYTLRNTRTGEIVEEDNLHVLPTPDANTRFFFVTIPANIGSEPLSLTVEAPPFLRRTVVLSEFLGRWTIRQPVTLLAGDIDGDNEVSLLDFSRLLAAFGSFAGEEQYDVDADLDGDGEISLWDLSWLLLHFGMAGDE